MRRQQRGQTREQGAPEPPTVAHAVPEVPPYRNSPTRLVGQFSASGRTYAELTADAERTARQFFDRGETFTLDIEAHCQRSWGAGPHIWTADVIATAARNP